MRVRDYPGVGGTIPGPLRIGPLRPADNSTTYFQPTLIGKQTFTDVAAADDDAFVLAKTGSTLPAAAGSVTFTPDGVAGTSAVAHARNVVIVVTHATAVVALSGVISGYNLHGAAITEAWSVTAGTASKTFTGTKAFARVSSITVVALASATANTVKAGTGNVLGLEYTTNFPKAMAETVDGALVTTGTIVAASAVSTADSIGTYAPASVPNGARDYVVWYLVDDPTL